VVLRTPLLCVSDGLRGKYSGRSAAGTGANAGLGAAKIEQYGCGSCHTIPGVPGARAHVGPPLTAFNRRTYIAGKLANDPANLELWIMHPHSVRPDTAMPEMGVTKNDAADIAAYLYLVR
jgi:cytochrome c